MHYRKVCMEKFSFFVQYTSLNELLRMKGVKIDFHIAHILMSFLCAVCNNEQQTDIFLESCSTMVTLEIHVVFTLYNFVT